MEDKFEEVFAEIPVVRKALGWIPLVGWIIKTVLGLAVTILMVIGIVNAATGKAKELPFIGGLMHVFE